MTNIVISGRCIGSDTPPYLIAELSGNHNGDINRAFAIMEAAKDAGVDAIKLQTYTADTLTINHDGADFKLNSGPWRGQTLYELYQEASTPWEWHERLFAKARELSITVFSSPFDETAVDFLEELGCPAYKIASFEAVDLALIRKAALTDKPVIVSTGMVTVEEIEELIKTVQVTGNNKLALLHCVSAYPATVGASNLKTIPHLSKDTGLCVGLSDHTLGTAVSVAAVSLGASIIEKHVTLNRHDGGPDSDFSLEPSELAALVRDCRDAWQAIGDVRVGRQKEAEGSTIFRRSLYIVEDMKKGEIFSSKNIRSIRPGFGMMPKHINDVLGCEAICDIARGTPLTLNLIRK